MGDDVGAIESQATDWAKKVILETFAEEVKNVTTATTMMLGLSIQGFYGILDPSNKLSN